ncbi:MAG: hypothetical protein KC550_05315 [Nanoarchaeota archaeon]|nr:hypothetical protein [Nanoarchaeota archaeon]
MVDFRAIIDNLVDIGFYSVILPFFLVYVVIFAILEKSDIFKGGSAGGKQVKNVNAVIAFVFALFVVASIQTVMIIQDLILNIVLVIIFLLVTLLLLGFIFGSDFHKLFRNEKGDIGGWVTWSIGLIVLFVALSIFLNSLNFWTWLFDWWNSTSSWGDETVTTVVVLLLIAAVLYWITKSDSNDKEDSK